LENNYAVIPDEILKKLAEVLLDNKTFQCIINGKERKIESYEIKEHYRIR